MNTDLIGTIFFGTLFAICVLVIAFSIGVGMGYRDGWKRATRPDAEEEEGMEVR